MSNIPTILITDDDEAAAHLIQTNLKRAGLNFKSIRAHNGREAIDILENSATDQDLASDEHLLMLLDIRMPKMDGIQVLEYVKSKDSLRKIPIIMLTTTDDPLEVENCYKLGCNFYITKPVDYGKFVSTIKNLAEYIKVCKIPLFKK